MIIRIKKRTLILFLLIFLVSVTIVYAPSTTERAGFKVDLVISNRNPIINVSNLTGGGSSFSVDPVSGGNARVLISFNVTDPDGVGQINASKAVVNFTLGIGGQYHSNVSAVASSEFGTCNNHTEGSAVVINCTVLLPYFANNSANWVINISVQDTQGGIGRNDSGRFTYNILSAISLPKAFVNFSNVNLGQQDVRAYPHLLINNTGNDDFDMVNMTAAALVGATTSSETIGVTNFGVNLTNSSSNQRTAFPSSGILTLTHIDAGINGDRNASLIHGHTSAFAPNADKGNISAFFWVNVPTGSLSSQLYNATWNVTAVNNP